jgi:hypothetical protein
VTASTVTIIRRTDLDVQVQRFNASIPCRCAFTVSSDLRSEPHGTAELIEDRDKSLLRPLWQKYLGQGPPGEAGDLLRLIVRVTPQKVTGFSA